MIFLREAHSIAKASVGKNSTGKPRHNNVICLKALFLLSNFCIVFICISLENLTVENTFSNEAARNAYPRSHGVFILIIWRVDTFSTASSSHRMWRFWRQEWLTRVMTAVHEYLHVWRNILKYRYSFVSFIYFDFYIWQNILISVKTLLFSYRYFAYYLLIEIFI